MKLDEKSVWQLCLEIAVDMEVLSSLPTTTRAKAEKIKAHLDAYLEAATPPDVAGLIAELADEADLCRNETATDIADLLDRAATALRLSTGGGWRSMDSAPMDGSVIIYLTKYREIGFCYFSHAINEDESDCWWDREADDEVFPRFWLPRPALPASPTVEAGHVE